GDRGRPRLERDRAGRDSGRGARARLRGGRRDRVRWQATAPGHSRARRGEGGGLSDTESSGGPATETAVEEEFASLDVDSPLGGIVMGSKSDMPVMEEAARQRDGRGSLNETRVRSAHRDPAPLAH